MSETAPLEFLDDRRVAPQQPAADCGVKACGPGKHRRSLNALTDQPADARAFAGAPLIALRREMVAPGSIAVASALVIVMFAAADAALRGPWLDEFWTLELADSRGGLLALISDGWLRDAHPPLFNVWASLLASIGVTSIAAGRLASNLPAAALMVLVVLRLSRRMPEQAGFNAAMLVLTLSLPQAIDAFATYRSYFWQITAFATLTLVARHVASTRVDLEGRRDLDLAAIAALATAAAIGLHYVGALFGGLLAGVIALCAFARGLVKWAGLMLAAAALSALFIAASVLLQAPNWATEFDHNWNDRPMLAALEVPLGLAGAAISFNPVPLVGLLMARRHGPERIFMAMLGAVLVAGIGLVLVIHAVRPIVVDRYLIAVPVLVCALMAVPAARLARDSRLFGLLALVSVAAAAVTGLEAAGKPLWRESAQAIARIVADCPTTQVYAASGWAVGPAAETRTARREDVVFERAYRVLAEPYGYAVRFIGQNGKADVPPGPCPVLLWVEHTPNEAEDDLPAAVEAAGLTGLQDAHLSAIRTATGFVVRADRP